MAGWRRWLRGPGREHEGTDRIQGSGEKPGYKVAGRFFYGRLGTHDMIEYKIQPNGVITITFYATPDIGSVTLFTGYVLPNASSSVAAWLPYKQIKKPNGEEVRIPVHTTRLPILERDDPHITETYFLLKHNGRTYYPRTIGIGVAVVPDGLINPFTKAHERNLYWMLYGGFSGNRNHYLRKEVFPRLNLSPDDVGLALLKLEAG